MGRVTLLELQKKNASRFSVFIDGEFALGIDADLAVQYGLEEGQEISAGKLDCLRAVESERRSQEIALRYIRHAPRSEHDVRMRLQRSGADASVVDRVISSIRDMGYLDDRTFARDYVSNRVRHKGFGPIRLRHELLRHGVPQRWIEEALTECSAPDALIHTARALAEKRWPRLSGPAAKRRRKMREFLVRRGYSSDIAHRVIRELESLDS